MEILVLLVTSLKLYLIKVKITEENISPYSSQKKKKMSKKMESYYRCSNDIQFEFLLLFFFS